MKLVMLFFLLVCFSLVSTMDVCADRDPTTIVEEAYEDILGRKPDKDGLRNYRSKIIDEGWSESDVRKSLRESSEYKGQDTDKIIKNAYEDLLGRKPDKAGYDNYKNLIENKGWSEKDVRNALRKSDEYKNRNR
ncbi:MAG: DUF4214 domain-containing protein [Verrucomicrobiae bacterium]|nr:DUF4214 domain-containing protein [Verrucomicrobiae bacterium]